MSNVLVEKNKLDVLATAISNKSGEPLKLTLDEMVEAVDGIEQNTGITPTGNIDITHAGTTDVTNYATATVPQGDVYVQNIMNFKTVSGSRKWEVKSHAFIYTDDDAGAVGYIENFYDKYGDATTFNAVPYGTTITPTESAQTIGGANSMMEGAVTVSAIPSNYVGSGITQRSSADLTVSGATVTVPSGYYLNQAQKSVDVITLPTALTNGGEGTRIATLTLPNGINKYLQIPKGYNNSTSYYQFDVPNGTAGTPTATKGTVSNHSVSVTPSVTNTTGYITGGTINGTAVSVSASELVSGTLNVTSAGTKDVTNYASASIPSGTEGTPTATKGTVSNHSVSVTPSVTNTSGFISGGTKNGTAVTVSASELVSGSETKTENGTYDVTNLAEIVIDVQGGGSSGVQVAVATPQGGANSYVQFGNLEGVPTSFSLINTHDIAIGTDPIVSALTYDGTNYVGQTVTNTSNANASYVSAGFSHSYDSHYGQIMISNENVKFDTHSNYALIYTYRGSASDIHTADVQVGSGATSITFPVSGRPTYWSCVFKSDFGTSSGYQRVIAATEYNSSIGGLCLDSSAHASNQYWTASYSGGNLTISSQSTNAGGYFHQPGYYQLTYIVDESAPSYQTKTVTPTTSQQVVSPDSGFDALSQVTVNAIPSQYIIPSGNINITSNTASGQTLNVSQYATATVNVSGGGGSSTCDTKTMTNSNDQATSIQFTGLSGEPKWFFVRCAAQMSRSSSYSYYYITAVRYNGTNHYGNYWRRSNGTFYNDTTHYSHTYSNGTLTVSSSASRGAAGGSFYNGSYELVYIY